MRIVNVIINLFKQQRMTRIAGIWHRFFYWQLRKKKRGDLIVQWVDNSQLIVRNGYTVATGNYYLGLLEYDEMRFFLNYVCSDDLIVDVGANIGDYCILASKCCGAKSIAFEPMPHIYNFMLEQLELNNITDQVKTYNIGLSDTCGELKFVDEGAMSYATEEYVRDTISVLVKTLDEVLNGTEVDLIKVDVEGMELNVLKGASKTLSSKRCNVVMAECNGLDAKYGANEGQLCDYLDEFGFKQCVYDEDLKKLVSCNDSKDFNNIIFVKDINYANEKIKKSVNHKIYGYEL